MKKLSALLLALLMLAGTVSCNSATTSSSPEEEGTPSATVSTPTPSVSSPSESPTPTPTPDVDPLEKKKYNTETSTEEEINVIPVGLYEFVLEDGRKLAYTDSQVQIVAADVTENTQFLVSFQNAGTDSLGRKNVRYVLYTGDSVKKSVYASGSTVSIKESNDRLAQYNWYIDENEDSTVRLKNKNGSTTKALKINDQDKVVLEGAVGSKLKMNLISNELKSYRQYISEKGDIILRISSQVKLTSDRIKKLTNDMQVAYETYYELTNFLPYESIVIRIYQQEPYFGYVYQGWNVISFNIKNATGDLGKIRGRDNEGINDWNFCLLHEMGHMFDWGRGWRFHGEFATNMKVAYVLYANKDVDASAATSGYGYKTCFDGDSIVEMWNTCPQMTEATGFNLDRVLYLFVSYAKEIGWDNVKKAYQEIQAMDKQETNQVKSLELFTSTMAKYAPENKNVKDTFKEGEWEILVEEIS